MQAESLATANAALQEDVAALQNELERVQLDSDTRSRAALQAAEEVPHADAMSVVKVPRALTLALTSPPRWVRSTPRSLGCSCADMRRRWLRWASEHVAPPKSDCYDSRNPDHDSKPDTWCLSMALAQTSSLPDPNPHLTQHLIEVRAECEARVAGFAKENE